MEWDSPTFFKNVGDESNSFQLNRFNVHGVSASKVFFQLYESTASVECFLIGRTVVVVVI
jgi:hypothetical protein